MTETALDRAHALMEETGEGPEEQMAFYAQLAATELFVMLTKEAEGDTVSPELFDLGDVSFILAFDTEERLASFAGRIVPYAALSGRAVARMLGGQGVGIAFNIEVAPSAMLLPPEAVDWLVETLSEEPQEAEARPETLSPPSGLPEALLTALDTRLAAAEGLARKAYLVGVTYDTGATGHLLGIVGAVPGAERALAQAVQEALTFSGLEAGALDVAFFDATDWFAASLARHGLRFDLPQPETMTVTAPGMDPANPPKLT